MHRTVEALSCHGCSGKVSLVLLVAWLALLSSVCLSAGCTASSPFVAQVATPVSNNHTEEPEKAIRSTNVATPTLPPPAPSRAYLVEAGLSVPANLNPLVAGNYASQRVTDNLFDSLLNVNAVNAVLQPSLAAQWQVSENRLTATFQLRPDVLWHDGAPFTANDVVHTFESILDSNPNSQYKANLVGVDTFFAPDEQTLVVAFDSPDCSLLYDVGQIPIVPQHLTEPEMENPRVDVPATQASWDHPIGTGPFKFKNKLPNGEIRLERNDGYFAGTPHVSEWVYRPFGDEQELLIDLRAGEVDLALMTSQDVQHLQADETVDLIAFPQPEYYALALNNAHSLLNDVRTRQALAYAIDRRQLVQDLLDGYGQIIDTPWLPAHWVYAKPDSSIDYDPAHAQQLLSEAGWTDSDQDGLLDKEGHPLQISIRVNSENSLRKRIAFAVQQYWIDVGISAELYFVEFNTLLERLFSRNFDAAVFSWPVHQDPDQSLLWASEESDLARDFNFISYANPVVDEALAEGLTVPFCDQEARSSAYQPAISTIAEEQPYIFLFVPEHIIAVTHRLSGVRPGPYSNLSWNVHEWSLEHPDG